MDFLRAGGGSAFSVAADGTGYAATVPVLGVSVGAWIGCAGGAGADDQYLVAAAGAVVDWVVADGGGIAVLSVLGEIGEERAGRRRESVRRKPSSDLLRI